MADRRPPLSLDALLSPAVQPPPAPLLQQRGGPGVPPGAAWVIWTFNISDPGPIKDTLAPGSKTIPPGGTLTLRSTGTHPTGRANQAGISAPYGAQGALVSLDIPWVARGQAVYLPQGGQVAPVFRIIGSTDVTIDWHPGPPQEWTTPLYLSNNTITLPPFTVDIVWAPDAALGTQIEVSNGVAPRLLGLGQTPAQIVPLDADVITARIPGASAVGYARCRA